MASFAEVIDGIVERVLVVANSDITDIDGVEHPEMALGFLPETSGQWIQTSYTGSIRGCFAGIGYIYDAEQDIFLPPPPPEPDAESLTQSESEA